MSAAEPTNTNTEVPKPEGPKSVIEKIGAALPIGLTALATVFAGMSTGALQQAMYWKSQAAQDQSKATNQWTLAGFKRDRALVMQTTAAQLRATCAYTPANFPAPALDYKGGDAEAEKKARELFEAQTRAHGWLTETRGEKAGPPPAHLPEITDPQIKALRDAIEKREPEAELLRLAARVKHESINTTLDDAERANERVDKEWEPIIRAAAGLVRAQTAIKPNDPEHAKKAAAATAAQAAGFDLEERRYRAESRLNQGIGFLYEIRTKTSSAESDKHRRKSQTLFTAMLVAQIGSVVSSLALARKHKSALWLFAATAGLVALGFGGYVLMDF
ncbi:MAG: hypothetical protein J0I06_03825 [Planctomycetes bacterium]|nr:hypothetical protein [Planctomycetota bacterium]